MNDVLRIARLKIALQRAFLGRAILIFTFSTMLQSCLILSLRFPVVRRIASQRAMQMKRKASESKVGLYTESSLFRSSTWNTYSWWHNPRWHCWQAPNNIARSKANFEIEFLTKNKYMNSPQCCQEQPGTRCIFLKFLSFTFVFESKGKNV